MYPTTTAAARDHFLKALNDAHGPISFYYNKILGETVYNLLTTSVMVKNADIAEDPDKAYMDALESVAFYCDGCKTWNTLHAKAEGSERCCRCERITRGWKILESNFSEEETMVIAADYDPEQVKIQKIQTALFLPHESAEPFDICAPDPKLITPKLLATTLSHLCRFNGHVPTFYSVAQHSVLVSRHVPPHLSLPALLHDAHEGLGLGDMITPLKRLFPLFKVLERGIDAAVAEAFGFDPALFDAPEIKEADWRMLWTEFRELRGVGPHLSVKPGEVELYKIEIEPWGMAWSYATFLAELEELIQ